MKRVLVAVRGSGKLRKLAFGRINFKLSQLLGAGFPVLLHLLAVLREGRVQRRQFVVDLLPRQLHEGVKRALGHRGAVICRRVLGQMLIHEARQYLDHELLKPGLYHKEPDGAADFYKRLHRHLPALVVIHLVKQLAGKVGRSVAQHTRTGLLPLIPIQAAVLVCVGLIKEGLGICRDPPAQQQQILYVRGEFTDERFIERIIM